LIKILASQIAQLINYSELSSTIGISINTLKDYLWYAEKTFVIKKLTPYFRNIRKEISKSPVVYFYDLGLRNYALGLFGNLSIPEQKGFVFENFVFNVLQEESKFTGAKLHFWRTTDKAEVDFVVDFSREVLPIEAKYKKFTQPKISRSLRSFIEKYKPKKAFVINRNFSGTIKIDTTKVVFQPFWKLLCLQINK